MACGCKKKKPSASAPVLSKTATEWLVDYLYADAGDVPLVEVRCSNCVGLLRTSDGKYLPMNSGDWYTVSVLDVERWRAQGWTIEVKA